MEEIVTCKFCGESKDDIRWTEDPYGYELNDDTNTYPICADCLYERAMDV